MSPLRRSVALTLAVVTVAAAFWVAAGLVYSTPPTPTPAPTSHARPFTVWMSSKPRVLLLMPTTRQCQRHQYAVVTLDSHPIRALSVVDGSGHRVALRQHESHWEFDCARLGSIRTVYANVAHQTIKLGLLDPSQYKKVFS